MDTVYLFHSVNSLTVKLEWKPGKMVLGCQFQFRCVEIQMSGFRFGLVSRLLKNRFQFCLRTASVAGFQLRLGSSKKIVFLNADYLNALLLGVFALLR